MVFSSVPRQELYPTKEKHWEMDLLWKRFAKSLSLELFCTTIRVTATNPWCDQKVPRIQFFFISKLDWGGAINKYKNTKMQIWKYKKYKTRLSGGRVMHVTLSRASPLPPSYITQVCYSCTNLLICISHLKLICNSYIIIIKLPKKNACHILYSLFCT